MWSPLCRPAFEQFLLHGLVQYYIQWGWSNTTLLSIGTEYLFLFLVKSLSTVPQPHHTVQSPYSAWCLNATFTSDRYSWLTAGTSVSGPYILYAWIKYTNNPFFRITLKQKTSGINLLPTTSPSSWSLNNRTMMLSHSLWFQAIIAPSIFLLSWAYFKYHCTRHCIFVMQTDSNVSLKSEGFFTILTR